MDLTALTTYTVLTSTPVKVKIVKNAIVSQMGTLIPSESVMARLCSVFTELASCNSKKAMVCMYEGNFQVSDDFKCDRMFLASIPEATYFTNMEALVINRRGSSE